jgi:hypothetical protein
MTAPISAGILATAERCSAPGALRARDRVFEPREHGKSALPASIPVRSQQSYYYRFGDRRGQLDYSTLTLHAYSGVKSGRGRGVKVRRPLSETTALFFEAGYSGKTRPHAEGRGNLRRLRVMSRSISKPARPDIGLRLGQHELLRSQDLVIKSSNKIGGLTEAVNN